MTTLSLSQVYQGVMAAGFRGGPAIEAVAIASAATACNDHYQHPAGVWTPASRYGVFALTWPQGDPLGPSWLWSLTHSCTQLHQDYLAAGNTWGWVPVWSNGRAQRRIPKVSKRLGINYTGGQ